MTSQTTRPVSLTDHGTLRQLAEAWIESNGLPNISLLWLAVDRTERSGDPFCDNPFRRALIEVARERGATPEGM